MTGHTAGPWIAHPYSNGNGAFVTGRTVDDPLVVCDDVLVAADLALIAAAPTLLWAIRLADRRLELLGDDKANPVRKAISSAIAAATRETGVDVDLRYEPVAPEKHLEPPSSS